MPVHNEEIAAAFDEIADLLSLSGENPFRIRAYRRAARSVRGQPGELAQKIAQGFDPDSLPGVGADLAGKMRELAGTGRCRMLERLRRSTPAGLRELLSLPGIGPQRARALYQALDIRGLAGLRDALEHRRVRSVPRFGPKLEERLRAALAARAQHGKRVYASVAAPVARALCDYLAAVPLVTRVEVAGSYRRGRDTVGDLDIVVCAPPGAGVDAALVKFDETATTLASGPTRSSVVLRSGLQVDVRVVPEESFGAALYYFTGSKAHNIRLRGIALSRGLKINEYGVFRGRKRIAGDSERSVLEAVGLPYIAPELREDRGEFEAALAGRLPALVDRAQLRGDLHVHTHRTDGTASLEEMADAAARVGLEYIAITDHSKYLGAVHGLDAAAVARQIDEIDAFNAGKRRLKVLKGIEVDILEDGTLALPDRVLKQLDVVVAAVHGQFTLPRTRQTNRLLRALDHPHISIIAHPTARLLEERAGIDCDWSKILRRASERPCYLELNAQPSRLDLDDVLVREAAASGALISIASDAHAIHDFAYLEAGVRQGRRGWLTPAQVLNTRPLREVRALLRRTSLN